MAIIRFNDEIFTTDSKDYEILEHAVRGIKGVPGAIVEIGTRMGGSAKLIIDTLVDNEDNNRSMFCIDPYGNIELECTNINLSIHYPGTEVIGDPLDKNVTSTRKFDYDNGMRNKIIPTLYYYAFSNNINFTFFCLEDTEFFIRYSDGVPTYNEVKKLENTYALVFFDGPHTNEAVLRELDFFIPRSVIGTTFIIDDVWMMEHEEQVEPLLFQNGFVLLSKSQIKASYKKVG